MTLFAAPVALALSGTHKEADAAAIAAACALPHLYAGWRTRLEHALFDHYAPCLEALQHGDLAGADAAIPALSSSADVWNHVRLLSIDIAPISGVMTTELAYATDWDIEHTLGARFVGDTFIELNGSI